MIFGKKKTETDNINNTPEKEEDLFDLVLDLETGEMSIHDSREDEAPENAGTVADNGNEPAVDENPENGPDELEPDETPEDQPDGEEDDLGGEIPAGDGTLGDETSGDEGEDFADTPDEPEDETLPEADDGEEPEEFEEEDGEYSEEDDYPEADEQSDLQEDEGFDGDEGEAFGETDDTLVGPSNGGTAFEEDYPEEADQSDDGEWENLYGETPDTISETVFSDGGHDFPVRDFPGKEEPETDGAESDGQKPQGRRNDKVKAEKLEDLVRKKNQSAPDQASKKLSGLLGVNKNGSTEDDKIAGMNFNAWIIIVIAVFLIDTVLLNFIFYKAVYPAVEGIMKAAGSESLKLTASGAETLYTIISYAIAFIICGLIELIICKFAETLLGQLGMKRSASFITKTLLILMFLFVITGLIVMIVDHAGPLTMTAYRWICPFLGYAGGLVFYIFSNIGKKKKA